MNSQDTKAETKAYTRQRPQDSPETSPISAEASIRHTRVHQVSVKWPTIPITGANPFPEVTDLICRLPLPTLFYRLEAVHLGDLMRISVRKLSDLSFPWIFKVPSISTRHRKNRDAFRITTSLSSDEPFPGSLIHN